MSRFLAMMRYSKKLLVLSICLLLDICLVFGICVFDVVQIIQISQNAVLLSPVFVVMNIVLIVLLACNIVGIIGYIVLRKIKERRHELKEN